MTNQTSVNLMQVTGISMQEIDRRLHLFDFTESDQSDLSSFLPVLEDALPDILDAFYSKQLQNREIAVIIGAPKVLSRLRMAMSNFLTTLFTANYDETYINSRLHIGRVHKKLDITPKLYMYGISTLQCVLDQYIDKLCPLDSNSENIKAAFHKALLFDSQLVFDAYIGGYQEEMESARAEVDRYASSLEIKVDVLTRQLHEESLHDALTCLYNRRTFNEYLQRELDTAKRYSLPVCLVYLDLNGFKKVNDTLGHDAGDYVLQQVGKSLNSIVRTVDIACRYGGDEFCIIMPRCNLDNVQIPIRRLIDDFDAGENHGVTFSIGVVETGPDNVMGAIDLIKKADGLMYEAKELSHKKPGHHICGLD